jgi:hypothetical protein
VCNNLVNDIIKYMNIDNTHASWRRNIIIRGLLFADEFAVSSITNDGFQKPVDQEKLFCKE